MGLKIHHTQVGVAIKWLDPINQEINEGKGSHHKVKESLQYDCIKLILKTKLII